MEQFALLLLLPTIAFEAVERMTILGRERRCADQMFVGSERFLLVVFTRSTVDAIAMKGDHQDVFRHEEDDRWFTAANLGG